MAEPEDEDNFPNDYDGLDFDNIPGLQAPTIHTPDVSVAPAVPRNVVPTPASSPVPSTGSNSFEDMDSSFLAAVDALEARAFNETSRGSESYSCPEPGGHQMDGKRALLLEVIDERLNLEDLKSAFDSPQGDAAICDHFHGIHSFGIEGTRNLPHDYEYSMQSPEVSSMNRKGKRKAEPREDIDLCSILAGYETELTCPICCDLLVGAQVANPCGHTCCGECGYGWLAQNKYEPTCAVCRSILSIQKPLLPNFSVDGFVRQHIQALARSGRPEWQEKGYRNIEWNKRLESWKKQAAGRAAKEKLKNTSRSRWCQPHHYEIEDQSYAAPWVFEEGMDDNEGGIFAHVMPRRRTRSRR